ncbi:MAG: MOSC domain-containing protein [Planctomycetaceae bacterium]
MQDDAIELETVLPQIGSVKWIGVSPARREPIRSLSEVMIRVGTGLDGDHHSTLKPGGKRQVTLIQWEHLPVVASVLGRTEVAPDELRRNIVVSGINLLALKQKQFKVGECVLEYTGPCVPCSLMEENLGPGGFNAMRGHGGITAQVVREGLVRIGDSVAVAPR